MAFWAAMCETCILFTKNSKPSKTEAFGDPDVTAVDSSKVDGSDTNRHQENETPGPN